MQSTEYLILDRTDPDRPLWQLVTVLGTRPAELDETGHYSADEWADVLLWVATALDHPVRLPYVPAPLVFDATEQRGRGLCAPCQEGTHRCDGCGCDCDRAKLHRGQL